MQWCILVRKMDQALERLLKKVIVMKRGVVYKFSVPWSAKFIHRHRVVYKFFVLWLAVCHEALFSKSFPKQFARLSYLHRFLGQVWAHTFPNLLIPAFVGPSAHGPVARCHSGSTRLQRQVVADANLARK